MLRNGRRPGDDAGPRAFPLRGRRRQGGLKHRIAAGRGSSSRGEGGGGRPGAAPSLYAALCTFPARNGAWLARSITGSSASTCSPASAPARKQISEAGPPGSTSARRARQEAHQRGGTPAPYRSPYRFPYCTVASCPPSHRHGSSQASNPWRDTDCARPQRGSFRPGCTACAGAGRLRSHLHHRPQGARTPGSAPSRPPSASPPPSRPPARGTRRVRLVRGEGRGVSD